MSLFGVGRLADYMKRTLPHDHPALAQLPAFVQHAVRTAELRLQRLGILDRPLAEISVVERARLVAEAYAGKAVEGGKDTLLAPLRVLPFFAPKKLTDTYLDDPAVRGYQHPNKRSKLEAVESFDEVTA